MNETKCPRPELLATALERWDSCIGATVVWPDGRGRFPLRGELLNAQLGYRVYSVTIGNMLRGLAKMHDAWDAEQLARCNNFISPDEYCGKLRGHEGACGL